MPDTVNLASNPTLFPSFSTLPSAISNLALPTLTGATPTADQQTALTNARGLVAPFNADQTGAFQATRDQFGNPSYDNNFNGAIGLTGQAATPGQGYTAGLSTIGGVQSGAGTALANSGNWLNSQGQGLFGAGLGAATTAAQGLQGTASTLGQAGANLLSGSQFGLGSQYTDPMQLQAVQPQQWNDQTAQQFMSPYMNSVMQSGLANLKNSEDVQSGQELARQAGLGSFTDRSAIYNAQLQKNFADTNSGFISNAMNSAYNTGLGAFNTNNALGVQAGLGNNSQALQAQGLGLQGATANLQAQLGQAGLGVQALSQTGGLQSGLMNAGIGEQSLGANMIGSGNSAINSAGALDLSGASLGINADMANRGLLNSTAANRGNLTTAQQTSDSARIAGLSGIGQQQQAQQQTINTAPQTLANWGAGIVAGVPYGSNRQVPAVSNAQLGIAGASMIPSAINAGTSLYNAINTPSTTGSASFNSYVPPSYTPPAGTSMWDSTNVPSVDLSSVNTNILPTGEATGGLISDHTRDPRLMRAFGGLTGVPSLAGAPSPGGAVAGLAGAAGAPAIHGVFMNNLRRRLAGQIAPKLRMAQGGLAGYDLDALAHRLTPPVGGAPRAGLARSFGGDQPGGYFVGNLDQALDSPWATPAAGGAQAGLAAPGVSVGPQAAGSVAGLSSTPPTPPAAAPSVVQQVAAGTPTADAAKPADDGLPFSRSGAESLAAFGAGLASAPLRFGGAGAAINGYLGAQRYARQEERQDEQAKAQAAANKLKAQETALGMVKTQADIDKENRAAKKDEDIALNTKALISTMSPEDQKLASAMSPEKLGDFLSQQKLRIGDHEFQAAQQAERLKADRERSDEQRRTQIQVAGMDKTPADVLLAREAGIDIRTPEGWQKLVELKHGNKGGGGGSPTAKLIADREQVKTQLAALPDGDPKRASLEKDLAAYEAQIAKDETKTFGQANTLRDEFSKGSKPYIEVRDAYNRVNVAAKTPSPAGDLSLLYNYMKILDPGSVVRESEFAAAAAAGSFGDKIQTAVSKVINGERLSDDQRKDFVSKANDLFKVQTQSHKALRTQYSSLANHFNIDPSTVVVDYETGAVGDAPGSAAAPVTRWKVQDGKLVPDK